MLLSLPCAAGLVWPRRTRLLGVEIFGVRRSQLSFDMNQVTPCALCQAHPEDALGQVSDLFSDNLNVLD